MYPLIVMRAPPLSGMLVGVILAMEGSTVAGDRSIETLTKPIPLVVLVTLMTGQ